LLHFTKLIQFASSSSLQAYNPALAFLLDLLIIPCISKLQSHSFGVRQLSVHLLCRFDSSSIVLDHSISRRGVDWCISHLQHSPLLNSCSNIIASGLGSSPSHQSQVSSFNLQVPNFGPMCFSLPYLSFHCIISKSNFTYLPSFV
jgi:hypothetical protein